MPDLNLVVPPAPVDVDHGTHLRSLLAAAADDAATLVERLHDDRVAHREMRDAAADASTRLRELRQSSALLLELEDVDEDEKSQMATTLYAGLQVAMEDADDVLMRSELLDALGDDVETRAMCDPHALCIGELAGETYTSFFVNEVDDHELFEQVRDAAQVPLMHALVRAVAAGFVAGRRSPLEVRDAANRIDQLLLKTYRQSPSIDLRDPLANLRLACIVRVALWNFVRISLRDDHGDGRRAQYEVRRREALRSIKADTRFQLEELGALPNYEQAYDVGVGLALVEPIIAQRAELHDVVAPRRASAAAWISLFDTPA